MFKFLLAKKKVVCATALVVAGTTGIVVYSLRNNAENKEEIIIDNINEDTPKGAFKSEPGTSIGIKKFTMGAPAEGVPLRNKK